MTNSSSTPEDRGNVLPDEALPAAEAPSETSAPEPEAAPSAPESDDRTIPHARFEELNQRLKLERESRLDLEARLDEVLRREETRKTPPFDAEAAEKDYLKAMLEGDTDKAASLMREIRRHDRQQIEQEVTALAFRQIEQATARTALETVAEIAIQQYPFLDPHHASANSNAINEVVEWRDYYLVAKKMTPAKALKSAVERIAPNYAKGAVSPNERTLAQRQANAQAAAHQPPLLNGVGERARRQAAADIAKMSDSEFSALSAADKTRLRGDAVV